MLLFYYINIITCQWLLEWLQNNINCPLNVSYWQWQDSGDGYERIAVTDSGRIAVMDIRG